jgi:cysteine-rich repeat protein
VLEECDDGDTDNTDECVEGCLDAVCGDGYVWEGEEACDDGINAGGYAGCEPGCGALGPHCGDSEINGPEICDDGVNDDSYGGCAPGCLELGPYCGDGEVYDGPGLDGGVLEECDDGDGEIGDGCTAECVEEYCGDDLVGWSRPKDGFEEGLTILPWETGTAVGMDGPFEVWGAGAMIPHSGDHMLASASPASFASDTRAYVQVTMDIVGDSLACFWYAGDKPFFSTFRFSVDGDEELVLNGLSADVPWTKLCVDVPAGDDTVFLWEYEQHWFEEGSVFYIDDVVLPLIQEECDDGNAASLDGCSAVCLSE